MRPLVQVELKPVLVGEFVGVDAISAVGVPIAGRRLLALLQVLLLEVVLHEILAKQSAATSPRAEANQQTVEGSSAGKTQHVWVVSGQGYGDM